MLDATFRKRVLRTLNADLFADSAGNATSLEPEHPLRKAVREIREKEQALHD